MSESIDIDLTRLTEFAKELDDLGQNELKKETKKFMRSQGQKLKRRIKKKAEVKVKAKTGNYIKSIKGGKPYEYLEDGNWAVRAYSYGPHAHLIEHGHWIWIDKGGVKGNPAEFTGKFAPGKFIFEESLNEYGDKYAEDLENFADEIIKKIGG